MADRRYLSIAETAEVLGVSDRLVYDLVAEGKLPAVELGRRKVVPLKVLELVEARALEGFDPDSVLSALAAAAGPSSTAASLAGLTAGGEGPTGTTGVDASPRAVGSVVPIR